MRAEDILLGNFESGVQERYGSLILREGRWEEAVRLGSSSEPSLAFRASWSLEWAFFRDAGGLMPYLSDMTEVFYESKNGSVHRHYAKMFAHMIKRGVCFTAEQRERILEKAFDLLIDPMAKVAVKMWCIEIIYLWRQSDEWIEEALGDTLENLLSAPDITPGFRNGAERTLRKLRKKR